MLSTLIVDDEALARQRLERLLAPLSEAGRLEIVGQASDAVEALEFLSDATPAVDLLLLDIRMPEMTGFDLLGRLDPEERPAVIFTTAYDRYALQAFQENAVDYLLKPINEERLNEAVARVERRRQQQPALSGERLEQLLSWVGTQQMRQQNDAEGAPAQKPGEGREEAGDTYARQISVSSRNRIRLIPTERVVAIEIDEGIMRLFEHPDDLESSASPGGGDDSDLRRHVIDYTLDTLEESLDPSEFMRVHRSAIVRLDCIQEMHPWRSGRYKLVLKGGHEVIASRDRSRRLRDRLVI